MFRLIALYTYYRDLQGERSRLGDHAAVPVMRVVPTTAVNVDTVQSVRALAA